MKVQFECGQHKGTVEAKTVGAAWRKLTKGKLKGFAPLVRYCIAGGVWHYISPAALDKIK